MTECLSFCIPQIMTDGSVNHRRNKPPVDLLRPMPSDEMTKWPVSQDVGNVGNNAPRLCEPG
jgi:putative SOS response-associated peptidase YedK